MQLKIGCSGFPIAIEDYFKKFKLVELTRTFYSLPKETTINKWKALASEEAEFTMRAFRLITHKPAKSSHIPKNMPGTADHDNYGHFNVTDEVMACWEDTKRVAKAIGARIVVFRSPMDFVEDNVNIKRIKDFFKAIDREGLNLVWEPLATWKADSVAAICGELDLTACMDPFAGTISQNKMRYLRLKGFEGRGRRYKGWDLKRLRDHIENEAAKAKNVPIYLVFDNKYRMMDALRFEWIMQNTGRIKEIDLSMLKGLCREIECREEEENVQAITREAERIVSLILYTDYKKVDIDIAKENLRALCKEMFPDKEDLYDMIYGGRFERLWQQFREEEEQEKDID